MLLLTWGQAVIGLLITVLLALVGRTKAGLLRWLGICVGTLHMLGMPAPYTCSIVSVEIILLQGGLTQAEGD